VFAKRFALLTYKDSELPVEKALNDAFTVLKQSFDLANMRKQRAADAAAKMARCGGSGFLDSGIS
jgi:hypothetical protein